jgi:preprotein translocase subunit SecG
MNILISVLLAIDVLVALLMILIILMQRPKSEGLGAAFGGGVTENIFGAQTTNVLTKFTGWLAGAFFVVTFLLSILYAQRSMGGSGVRRELLRANAAQAAASPVAAPATGSPAPAPSASAKPSDLAVGAVAQQPVTTATPAASVAATPPRVP